MLLSSRARSSEVTRRARGTDAHGDDAAGTPSALDRTLWRMRRATACTCSFMCPHPTPAGERSDSICGATDRCSQLINNPKNVVDEMIDGVTLNPDLQRIEGDNVVVRAKIDKSKVALISGGGSGHEPSHAGWVGAGMLTAAVAGPVFASPASNSVLAAIMHVTGSGGCLVIVKNYTGDRLWFGLACEQVRSSPVAAGTSGTPSRRSSKPAPAARAPRAAAPLADRTHSLCVFTTATRHHHCGRRPRPPASKLSSWWWATTARSPTEGWASPADAASLAPSSCIRSQALRPRRE